MTKISQQQQQHAPGKVSMNSAAHETEQTSIPNKKGNASTAQSQSTHNNQQEGHHSQQNSGSHAKKHDMIFLHCTFYYGY
ncbi:hypothetical protein B0O80DRAFT_497768 [Mortierella sp. GBAus27b]|nr:hypothetical protein B0O80DRAFT_497768 [Mortierella sp. GBAus27b]